MTKQAMRVVLTLVALLLGSCAPKQAAHVAAKRDFKAFQEVYPVLIRDCAFHACHGSPARFFRIYGAGRARLDPKLGAFDLVTGDEISTSFELTLAMVDAEHPERSLLLRKPLTTAAGGQSHGGLDDFGRNVYRTTADDGYRAIEKFVMSMSSAQAAK